MAWELAEAMAYYKKQGAPSDQSALVSLLHFPQQRYQCALIRRCALLFIVGHRFFQVPHGITFLLLQYTTNSANNNLVSFG